MKATGRATPAASPWQELIEIASRTPRFDPARFGRCRFCALGPTFLFEWASVTWAACQPCAVRWCAGERLIGADVNAAGDCQPMLAKLASLEQAPPPAGAGNG